MKRWFSCLWAVAVLMGFSPATEAAEFTLKFATLAPEGSAWMNTFEQVKKEVLAATGGRLQMKVYPGGVLGEEKDVLYKIKVGQVDGAGFIGYGIGKICPDARALMVPFMFDNYEEVDSAFGKMTPYLEEHCLQNGFVALGWTEIGFSYLYSTQPVRSVEDLKRAKPWSIPNEQLLTELFKAGNISTIPVPVSDVLTALQTGLIETFFSPPLAAVAMQWYSKVKYWNDLRLAYTFGGLFVSKKSWDKLPEDIKSKVLEICHRRMKELTLQVRKSNEDAIKVIASSGVQTVHSSEADIQTFLAIRDNGLVALKDVVFSSKALDMVQKYRGEYKASQAGQSHGP
jgi:TRAP-type C4-dicarboxylate transport system substrate-binding protein